jgi:hypothetical protein
MATLNNIFMPHKRKNLKIKGENLWYLVGLIASDGNLSPDGRHIDITSSDYAFLQKLKRSTGITNKIGIKYGKNKKESFHIQMANRNFYDFLLSIGITQKKSLTISEINVPDIFFVDFLRGVIDGDGSIRSWKHPTNNREQWSLRICSGSKKFVIWLDEKIKDLLQASGRIHADTRQGAVYVLKFGKLAAQIILRQCYYRDSLNLDRKNQLAQKCVHSKKGWKKSKTVFV